MKTFKPMYLVIDSKTDCVLCVCEEFQVAFDIMMNYPKETLRVETLRRSQYDR